MISVCRQFYPYTIFKELYRVVIDTTYRKWLAQEIGETNVFVVSSSSLLVLIKRISGIIFTIPSEVYLTLSRFRRTFDRTLPRTFFRLELKTNSKVFNFLHFNSKQEVQKLYPVNRRIAREARQRLRVKKFHILVVKTCDKFVRLRHYHRRNRGRRTLRSK